MQTVKIKTATGAMSQIIVGEDYKNLHFYLPLQNVVAIIDKNVFDLYQYFSKNYKCIIIDANEKNKTLETVENIIAQLVSLQADRATFIVGIGGGITCDIAGFVASVYMRGLQFGFVATSLLSQVDASVGGKNGVNFNGLKNMIGVFKQPEFVICDTKMLATLHQNEFISGLGEIVKMALIKDAEMFELIENNTNTILKRDNTILQQLILKSIQHKADIVQRDEFEREERMILNFGHTFAHAIELNCNILHGFAVSIGIMFALKISQYFGFISLVEIDRIKTVFSNLNLPLSIDIDNEILFKTILNDKKKNADEIKFVMLETIGKAIVKPMKISELKQLISLCKQV
jgi:3-dehydroquinate synthase